MHTYLVIFITLIAAGLAAVAQILFKRGLNRELKSFREIFGVVKERNVIIGIVVYFIGLAVYLFALKNAPLSLVYPTFGSVFIFTALLSAALLGEHIGRMRAIGIAIVFVGIVLVSTTI